MARDWTEERNLLIRKAHADGHSLRTTAEAVGLTHAGVTRIVKRGEK